MAKTHDDIMYGAMTLERLHVEITKILAENPINGGLLVGLDGCDCVGLLGSVRVDQCKQVNYVFLQRTPDTQGGW